MTVLCCGLRTDSAINSLSLTPTDSATNGFSLTPTDGAINSLSLILTDSAINIFCSHTALLRGQL